jgi:nucleotide-binding universal stress UspA family protein
MTDLTTILVPIRYPLTDESTRTLEVACDLAREEPKAELLVLHVDPFQSDEKTRLSDLRRAISTHTDGVSTEVITRRGFFVEEVILEEVEARAADVVVVGADRTPRWRRLLRRLLGNDPAIGPYLRTRIGEDTRIVEVDGGADVRSDVGVTDVREA